MASVNKVILVGNCGRDPEVRYLPSGQAVASVSIATSNKRKDRETGNLIEDTQWHRISFFDRLAEIVGEYVKKGAPLYVEGRLRYGKYTDKEGIERHTVDIIASEMQLLGNRNDSGSSAYQNTGASYASARETHKPTQATETKSDKPSTGFDDMDDDIPF
jgi:single-strand DNA-binding protein